MSGQREVILALAYLGLRWSKTAALAHPAWTWSAVGFAWWSGRLRSGGRTGARDQGTLCRNPRLDQSGRWRCPVLVGGVAGHLAALRVVRVIFLPVAVRPRTVGAGLARPERRVGPPSDALLSFSRASAHLAACVVSRRYSEDHDHRYQGGV